MTPHEAPPIYEVVVTLAPGTDSEVFTDWMRDHHIPALLATRCFTAASFEREQSLHPRFRVRYFAIDRGSLDTYLAEHASRIRADFQRHFGEGATVRRETWEVLEVWEH